MRNKRVLLLNYLLNKKYGDRFEMDRLFHDNDDYTLFSKKIYGPVKKTRIINNKIFGIEIEIYES
jgi:hypothetical protein